MLKSNIWTGGKQMANKIRLEKVNYGNFDDLVDLEVNESQKNYVADNVYSLAEAYATTVSGGIAIPFGIYCDDKAVGFLMIGYCSTVDDLRLFLDEDEEESIDYYMYDSYMIWRFMIGKDYQGKGYGREAMKLALDYIRTCPCGSAKYIWLSYEPENEVAKNLYRSAGFVEVPEMPKGWDEIPAVMKM